MYTIQARRKNKIVFSGNTDTLQEARDIAQVLFEAHYKVQVEDYTMSIENGLVHFEEMYCDGRGKYCYAEDCEGCFGRG